MTPMMKMLRGTTMLHPNASVLRDPLTGMTALFTTFAGGVATTVFVPTFLFNIGVGLVTSWALKALAPKPKLGGFGGMLTNTLNGTAPQQYVYGQVRKGGTITFYESTGANNKYLHQIISLAGHEVEEIGDIYINDEIVTIDGSGFVTSAPWNSKIRIKKHLGSDSQVADPDLVSETSVTSDFRGRGIAYMYVRLEYDQSVFANGIPTITAVVKGKKVYDPRTSTTAWSDNAALCVRDYLIDARGLKDSGIDDTMLSVSANVCDELVALSAGGSEKRYTMNGVVSSDATPETILQNMMTSCAGTLFRGQGAWKLKVGYYTAPVKTFTLDDLRSSIQLQTRVNMAENFNAVQGTFVDSAQDWIPVDFPKLESATFVAEDGGTETPIDMELPFTTSSATAQRIAKMTLFRGREQMTFSADFGLSALDVQVGDIVSLTMDRYGWTAKEFEIVGWKFFSTEDDLRINMTLRETSEAAFDWNADEMDIIGSDASLVNPFNGLTINNLTATGGGRTQGDGTFINSAILNWDAASGAFVSYYDVEWKALADSVYNATTSNTNSIELSPLVDGVEYIFRVRSVTIAGLMGDWATVQFTGGGDETAPGLPTSVAATGHFKYINVTWENPADTDLNYVEIWENTSNTTLGATKVGISAGDTFVRANLGLNSTRWYFLKAVDYSGNASAFTAGVSATTTYLDDPDFANGVYSLFTDQGLYAIRDVTSLPPSGAFIGEKVFNRTDGKLYQWTGSAWEIVIADIGSFAAYDKIIANTITGGLLQSSGIITNSAQINDAVVTNAKIQNAAITTAKIGDNQVTFPQAISGSSWVDLNLASGETEVQSLTVTRSGAPAMITAGAIFATVNGGFHGYSRFNYRLYRDGVMVKGYLNCKNQGQDSPSITMFHTDTHSATCTYSLRVEVVYLYDENITHQRVLTPYISFVELKK